MVKYNPNNKDDVCISERQEKNLIAIIESPQSTKRDKNRSATILLLAQGYSISVIAHEAGIDVKSITQWRSAWCNDTCSAHNRDTRIQFSQIT